MKKPSKKLISILLCVTIVLIFTSCSDISNQDSVAGIKYYHYNTTDFNDNCDKLKKLAGGDSLQSPGNVKAEDFDDKVISLYDNLYKECEEMDTLYTVAYVKYSIDRTDEYYSDEQSFAYNNLIKSSDRFCGICRILTESPYADKFREHVGEDAFTKFSKYEVMTKEEKKLVSREKKLVDNYYTAIEKASSESFTYKNKKWALEDISGEEGSNLAPTDYNGYIKIYDRIMENANKAAGPIYIKLIGIRDRKADLAGFDSYADYSDRYEYNRDYTVDDIDQLHSDVKKISSRFFDIYYSSAAGGIENSVPQMSEKKLLETLNSCCAKVGSLANNSCKLLQKEKLYSIGDEDCRQDGAFTTYIGKAKKPFISMTMNNYSDFPVLTHEFGHFVEYNNSKPNNILTDEDNIDLAEISSNGFEGLMTHYYPDIFGESASSYATKYVISDLLENVIDGCILDEFQREVYENPDMTLKEINKTFSKIDAEYNKYAEKGNGYYWVFVNHNYEAPMYYISYTVSGLAALQIWDMSQENFVDAVKVWEEIIKEGSFNKSYQSVIKRCGLMNFTEKGVVKTIFKPALKTIGSEKHYNFKFN